MPAPVPKPVVRWFTNEQGFITSDVKTNNSWASLNDTNFSTHLDENKHAYDPLEDVPEFAEAFRTANAHAEVYVKRWEGQMGRVHMYWKKKKEVLRESFKIDWKSPAELNPLTSYD